MITVRPGTLSDRDFVVETARRFAAFGPPPWRTPQEIVAGEVRCLDTFFERAGYSVETLKYVKLLPR